jgi:hypoxanthine phosphoribosyltransferase
MNQTQLKLLFSKDYIAEQVQRLGQEISRDHSDSELVMVCILKGSFLFFADLVRAIEAPLVVDFMRVASYGSDTQTSGIVEVRKDLEIAIAGRDVVIVEDIIDSGHTLRTLYNMLLLRNPRSLKICTLIDKRSRREVVVEADYAGITMDDGFIIGYGLDFDERYRNLADIFVVEPA